MKSNMDDDVLVPDGIARLAYIICGCGDSDESWKRIMTELERCEKPLPRAEVDWEYDHIVACLADHAEMIEHGSSLSGAWLTDEGVKCLAFLRQWGVDWRNKATMVGSDGVVHGWKED